MLNSWSTCNRIILKDQRDFVTAILEPGPQLQWRACQKEETKAIEQFCKARGIEITQDHLLGEGERQSIYDAHTLVLWHAASLNSWDRIEEVGKKIESLTKITQGLTETFTDFLQRLTSAVNRMITNSEARQIIIESLENTTHFCIMRKLWQRQALNY